MAVSVKVRTFYDMTPGTMLFVGESVWKDPSASIIRLKVVGLFYLNCRGNLATYNSVFNMILELCLTDSSVDITVVTITQWDRPH
jgi:hypothetical protein